MNVPLVEKDVHTGAWSPIHIKGFAIGILHSGHIFSIMGSPKKVVWAIAVTKAPAYFTSNFSFINHFQELLILKTAGLVRSAEYAVFLLELYVLIL